MAFYEAQGILNYKVVDVGYRLVVDIEQDICEYYRSLIPKYKGVKGQRHKAHISVVRHEIPINLEAWGKYQGEEIDFIYDNDIKWGTVYYWLNCFSKRLEEIRTELGLPVSSPYTRPPESFLKCFHTTIGNAK